MEKLLEGRTDLQMETGGNLPVEGDITRHLPGEQLLLGLGELAAVLEEEADVYGVSIGLACKKRDALREGNLDSLEETIRAEQLLIWQINRLEKKRLSLERELADGEKQRGQQMPSDEERSLRFWIGRAAQGTRERLESVRTRLLAMAAELGKLNELNFLLVKQAAAYLDFALEAIMGSAGAGVYGPSGLMKETTLGASRLSQRV